MKKIPIFLFMFGIVLLGGCAPSALQIKSEYHPVENEMFTYKIIQEAEVSDEALEIMNERLRAQLADCLLDGSVDVPHKVIEIQVTDYYMRNGAVRFMVGIMAGVDHIVSTVTITDAFTNETIAEFDVESKNPSAWGSSRGLIEDHIDQIVKYLKTGHTG